MKLFEKGDLMVASVVPHARVKRARRQRRLRAVWALLRRLVWRPIAPVADFFSGKIQEIRTFFEERRAIVDRYSQLESVYEQFHQYLEETRSANIQRYLRSFPLVLDVWIDKETLHFRFGGVAALQGYPSILKRRPLFGAVRVRIRVPDMCEQELVGFIVTGDSFHCHVDLRGWHTRQIKIRQRAVKFLSNRQRYQNGFMVEIVGMGHGMARLRLAPSGGEAKDNVPLGPRRISGF